MEIDALHRRLRYERPQPLATGISLQPRDYAIFEALLRHGPLPTHYLYEFTKHLNTNRIAFQHRLTKLYNGAQFALPLLTRPPQQFASFKARYQPLIYELSALAIQLLAERGRPELSSPCSGPFLHRFMAACVVASIELACRERGLTYLSFGEIIVHGKIDRPNPLCVPLSVGTSLIPDGLFGIRYQDGSYRFFAVEIDRNTESIERRRLEQSSFARKIQGYIDILTHRAYKPHWGIPNLIVLTVTTSLSHLHSMLGYLDGLATEKAGHFLFKGQTEFGANWEVPEVIRGLLNDPWQGIKPFLIDRP